MPQLLRPDFNIGSNKKYYLIYVHKDCDTNKVQNSALTYKGSTWPTAQYFEKYGGKVALITTNQIPTEEQFYSICKKYNLDFNYEVSFPEAASKNFSM